MSQKVEIVLRMYDELMLNDYLDKKSFMEEYGLTDKSFERYLKNLREYLGGTSDTNPIPYKKSLKRYELSIKDSRLRGEQVLAISKILLESRAFNKMELELLLDKLIHFTNMNEKSSISHMIKNERENYQQVLHGKELMNMIWKLNSLLKSRCYIRFTYQRADGEIKERTVEPVGLIFSEYYFYLVAHIEGKSYKYPAIFRVDRIIHVDILNRMPDPSTKVKDMDRFQEGVFRQQIAFMQTGELMNVTLRIKQSLYEVTQDRFPNLEVVSKDNAYITVRMKVFGKGIAMWLLSQGTAVEVMSPPLLRESMKKSIEEMQNLYK